MSRIGRMPITVPAGVEVTIAENNVVTVKGPKGTLTQALRPEMILEQDGNTIHVKRPSDDKLHCALHGMTLTDSGNGHKVTVDADDSFDHAVLWQQDAESFVCMEPWNGWANSVNEEGKHEVLEPDEAMTADWSITIEKV